ncbi:MAG: hypothetical protein M9885_07940 [Burkholderiaceae bacterium]|nr:hypothetical protein [Burkholderiaceae bacterium]
MRCVERLILFRAYVGTAVLVFAVAGSPFAQAANKISTLRIESVPSAAEVELIGGKAGVTPLTIDERDIYPNNYADARADMYGMVVLRYPGCEPLRHRVTLTDMKQGLHLRLDCGATAAQPKMPPVPSSPARSTAPIPPVPSETISQRRLRQLQVLQELLDEGLVSPAEEQRVRRRILQPEVESGKQPRP